VPHTAAAGGGRRHDRNRKQRLWAGKVSGGEGGTRARFEGVCEGASSWPLLRKGERTMRTPEGLSRRHVLGRAVALGSLALAGRVRAVGAQPSKWVVSLDSVYERTTT
jgi:hypothetical protein